MRFRDKFIDIGVFGDFFIGGVTSLGIFFFISSLLSFESEKSIDVTTLSLLKIISISILSGVGGSRLLIKESGRLEAQILHLEEENIKLLDENKLPRHITFIHIDILS